MGNLEALGVRTAIGKGSVYGREAAAFRRTEL
jgi:hypothetical protein